VSFVLTKPYPSKCNGAGPIDGRVASITVRVDNRLTAEPIASTSGKETLEAALSTLESLAKLAATSGIRLAPFLGMTRSFGAAVNANDVGYDPETTITLGPDERRQLLAEAFASEAIEQETTLRMAAPATLAGMPSPLGDDDAPTSGERPTRPMPVFQPTTLSPTRAGVLALSGIALALVSALVFAVLVQ